MMYYFSICMFSIIWNIVVYALYGTIALFHKDLMYLYSIEAIIVKLTFVFVFIACIINFYSFYTEYRLDTIYIVICGVLLHVFLGIVCVIYGSLLLTLIHLIGFALNLYAYHLDREHLWW